MVDVEVEVEEQHQSKEGTNICTIGGRREKEFGRILKKQTEGEQSQ